MAYYVKVKPEVKERILPSFVTGTKSADGNIILFQSDLNGVTGLTLYVQGITQLQAAYSL